MKRISLAVLSGLVVAIVCGRATAAEPSARHAHADFAGRPARLEPVAAGHRSAERRPGAEMVRGARGPRPRRPRCRGSSRTPFPAITAWPGTGAISTPPPTRTPSGRYLLRFWAVDYKAEVWLNGTRVGEHEGGEDPVRARRDRRDQAGRAEPPGRPRAQSDATQPIDGIVLNETPHRNKVIPYCAGSVLEPGRDHRFGRVARRARGPRRATSSSGPTGRPARSAIQATVRQRRPPSPSRASSS